eukprot:GHVS01049310.1.p1 GENE.GHVS01049310.1~~GHVS01049310.1.p1  ORF type:complete len:644 (-),score=74.68 GHVS01049310.1:242-2173(-)
MMVGESSSLSRLGFCWRLTLCCLLMLVVLVKGNNVDVSDSLENAEPVDMTHQQFVKQKPSPPYYVRITELKELPKEVEQKELPKEGHETPATVVTSVEGSEGVALFFFHGLQSELPKWQGQIELYLNNLVSNVPVYLWVPEYHETIRSGFIEAGGKVAPSFVKGIKHLQDLKPKIDCLFFCHSVGCLTLFHLLLPLPRTQSAIGYGDNAGGVETTKQSTWPVDQLCSKTGSLTLREVSMKGCPFLGFKTDSQFRKWDIPAGDSAKITHYGGIIDDLRLANDNVGNLWTRLDASVKSDKCSVFHKTDGLVKGQLNLFGAEHDEVVDLPSSLAAPWGVEAMENSSSGLERQPIAKPDLVEAEVGDLKRQAVGNVLYGSLDELSPNVRRYAINIHHSQDGFHMTDFPSVPSDSVLAKPFLEKWFAMVEDKRTAELRYSRKIYITPHFLMERAVVAARKVITDERFYYPTSIEDNSLMAMLVDMFQMSHRSVKGNSKEFPHNFLISNGIGTELTGVPLFNTEMPYDQRHKLMRNDRDEVYEEMCKLELAEFYTPGSEASKLLARVNSRADKEELKLQADKLSRYIKTNNKKRMNQMESSSHIPSMVLKQLVKVMTKRASADVFRVVKGIAEHAARMELGKSGLQGGH